MTVKTCDICKTESKDLNEVQDEYKVSNVVEICDSCMERLNDVNWKAVQAQSIVRRNFMRDFIRSIIKKPLS